jgi:hypothetical protein
VQRRRTERDGDREGLRRRLSAALPGLKKEARAAPGFHASLLRGAPGAARKAEVFHMTSIGEAQSRKVEPGEVGWTS